MGYDALRVSPSTVRIVGASRGVGSASAAAMRASDDTSGYCATGNRRYSFMCNVAAGAAGSHITLRRKLRAVMHAVAAAALGSSTRLMPPWQATSTDTTRASPAYAWACADDNHDTARAAADKKARTCAMFAFHPTATALRARATASSKELAPSIYRVTM